MSWIQQNKVPAAILGVSAAGVAGLGYMLFSAYSSYNSTLENFDTVNGSIAALKSAVLAPTPENLATKQGLVKEFTDASGKLSLVLNTMQAETQPKATTDTEFQAKLKAKIADSRKMAGERGMGLPAVYNLAFDRYTGELPKSNEVATELSGYLDAVDTLVNTFAKAGVRQVDSLERSELDSEKAEAAKPKSPAAKGPAPRPGAPAATAPKLTTRRQITTMLTLDQAALQTLLSDLASPSGMPYFTVVRLLRIENERQEGPLRAETNVLAPTPIEGGAAPVPSPDGSKPAAAPVGAAPAAADSVAVLGNERLRVYLEIDLVSFVTPQTAAAAPGTR